jgi:gas vesicle protein
MADRNGGGEFFAGLVIGGMVGAAMALLMAPQSGEATRSQIRSASLEIKDRAAVTMLEAREKADAIKADARRRAEDIVGDARQRASQITEEAQEEADEASEA